MDKLWENMYNNQLDEGAYYKASYNSSFPKSGSNYVMTTPQFGGHMSYLKWYVKWKKTEKHMWQNFRDNGMFDKDEWVKIEAIFKILEINAIPRAMIKIKDPEELSLF